jgi:hypothetical protein
MANESRDPLEEAVTQIEAGKQTQKAIDNSIKQSAINEGIKRDKRIRGEYDTVIVPFEEKYVTKHTPSELVNLLDNFGTKLKDRFGIEFTPTTIFDWELSENPDNIRGLARYVGESKNTKPQDDLTIKDDEYHEWERVQRVWSVFNRVGPENSTPSFSRIYRDGSGHYFGFVYTKARGIEAFVPRQQPLKYTGKSEEYTKVVNTLAKIIADKNIEVLTTEPARYESEGNPAAGIGA